MIMMRIIDLLLHQFSALKVDHITTSPQRSLNKYNTDKKIYLGIRFKETNNITSEECPSYAYVKSRTEEIWNSKFAVKASLKL